LELYGRQTEKRKIMAARKQGAQSAQRDFWSKMLAARKVRRILEKRGFDAEAFRKDYELDTNRGPRKASKPSEKEINAVEGFVKSGDYEKLLDRLDTESRPKADSALRRVLTWKGQGGVKTIRRRGAD
jgi:hypothetical protein